MKKMSSKESKDNHSDIMRFSRYYNAGSRMIASDENSPLLSEQDSCSKVSKGINTRIVYKASVYSKY